MEEGQRSLCIPSLPSTNREWGSGSGGGGDLRSFSAQSALCVARRYTMCRYDRKLQTAGSCRSAANMVKSGDG